MLVTRDALKLLDESPVSSFHFKMVLTAGMGFFTDAYDLFIIGTVSTILMRTWHISTLQTAWLSSVALFASVIGAVVFGVIADRLGRKVIYGYELLVLAAGAIASALAPNILLLFLFRFVLGIGIGGDYPVSSTLISEYANRRDRGKLITLVFSTQALGLIVGPLLTVAMLSSGVPESIIWRILLAFGAVPALCTFWLRRQIEETPRFAASQGDTASLMRAVQMATGDSQHTIVANDQAPLHNPQDEESRGKIEPVQPVENKTSWQKLFTTRHFLIWLIGAAGSWFLLDIAYYGTTVSTPIVINLFRPQSTLTGNMLYTLFIFVVAALPGYIITAFTVDRLGRKPIQIVGFAMMALSFSALFFFPGWTTMVAPFLICYGLAYFFTEFGPNITTFLYPAEIFPVTVRSTAHGIAAASGKCGAFIGAFLFPLMLNNSNFLLPGTMGVAAIICVAGFLLSFTLPEPKQKSLEQIELEGEEADRRAQQRRATAYEVQ